MIDWKEIFLKYFSALAYNWPCFQKVTFYVEIPCSLEASCICATVYSGTGERI